MHADSIIIGMMRGKHVLAAGALVAAAIAAAALLALRRGSLSPGTPIAAVEAPHSAEFLAPARIRAQHVVAVPAPVEGVIDALLVEVGEQVYEGQVLGRIRNTALDSTQQAAAAELESAQTRLSQIQSQMIVLRADLARARSEAARAQADADRAERAYQRQQMLFKEGATPRLVYEKAGREFELAKGERETSAQLARGAEDRLEAARNGADAAQRTVQDGTAALDHARESAAAAEIHSPVTGLLVERTRQVGEEVTPEVPDLFQIATDLTALEAVLEPPARELARIRPGQEAVLVVADAPDAVAAPVSEVRGNQVFIRFTSPGPALRPGISAQARIKLR